MLETGSVYWNPLLAAPFGQDAHAVPALYTLDYAIQHAIVALTRDPFLSYNLFYLLCPILNAVCALYALRRLGVSAAGAVPCAILYGTLYEVFWRTSHPFVAAYYVAPLACLVALRISLGGRPGCGDALIAVAAGLQSHYEAFFACSLVVAGAIIAVIQRRSARPAFAGLGFCAVTGISFLANIAPSLVWQLRHGSNAYATTRRAEEAITFALSIGQMVLPIPDHRIPLLAFWRSVYDGIVADAAKPPLINENASATLGLVATIGLVLLVSVLIARSTWRLPRTLEHAALLATTAIAIGTIGGLGAMFNVAITAQVRSYNRISTFIAFFCLLAVAYALDAFQQRMGNRAQPAVAFGLSALVVAYGVFDQSPAHTLDFTTGKMRMLADRAWTQRIAAAVPRNAAILELPYVVFPDMPSIGYAEFVPYLFSPSLRWSVGALDGSKEAGFEERLAAEPPGAMIADARRAGFDAVLVFRDGSERDRTVEAALRAKTGREPILDEDASRAFFSLVDVK